jgi:hypothetical protein
MKEVSEAVEVERQRHAIARRVGLAREAQLEVDFDNFESCSIPQNGINHLFSFACKLIPNYFVSYYKV